MINITFVGSDGQEYPVLAPPGTVLMRAAMDQGVPGIMGDCGGQCTCATCHCYIESSFLASLPETSPNEVEMLEGAIDPEPAVRPCIDALKMFACLYLDAGPLVERRIKGLVSLLPIVDLRVTVPASQT